ncbi:MAG: GNAT family N-acetyltransferase [Acidobacteriota bacterium]|nr:GNAT family N-acetyltransferase [Acidobacteriota bacterium]
MSKSGFTIRPAGTRDDLAFLREMLFEAAAVSDEIRAMGREKALALPFIAHILEHFGRQGDFGFVAENEDKILIGAVWARLFPAEAKSFGFVSPEIPELAIAVAPGFRGLGVGTKLLEELIKEARNLEFSALSLSVDRRNPALNLYERLGFSDAGVSKETDSSLTMILYLRSEN